MAKRVALCAFLFSAMVWSAALAQTPAQDEANFIKNHVSDIVTTTAVRISDPALDAVFSSQFYKIGISLSKATDKDLTNSGGFIVVRTGDTLEKLEVPITEQGLPQLVEMLNPKYKLVNNTDAEAFQNSLNILLPVRMSKDRAIVKFTQKGNEWIFVRGTFFDNKLWTIIVSTDSDGSIKSIKSSLWQP